MTLNRRLFVQSGLATLTAQAGLANAQASWPQRTVKFVVPFAPGGGADAATRMLADQLRIIWGGANSAVIDNKTGANTIIAANAVLSAPRDGYTFLATIGLTTQLPHLGQKLSFNPTTDLVPVGAITVEQLVLVVNANSGIKNFAGLVERIKSGPKGYAFGTFGVGSTAHLVVSQIVKEKGLDITQVHYRGTAPAVQAVLSGEVGMVLSNLGTVQQHIAAGKLVPIAVTGSKRYRFIPDVPTLTELGIAGLGFLSWIGVFAAKGTPSEVIQKMGADMRKALQAPELVSKLNGFYQEPGQMSVEEFQALVKADDEMAAKLIRAHQIRLE